MDAQQLRELQAPIKSLYRDQPEMALVTLKSSGNLGSESLTCSVETGRGIAEAGLHELAGGDGTWACSGNMLLEALVACAGVTLKAVATATGIEIHSGTVYAEGDLDFRGTLGVDKAVPVGFQAIRLRFELETNAGPEQLGNLLKLTERYCVIYQSLKNPPRLLATIASTPPA